MFKMQSILSTALLSALITTVSGQGVGTNTAENHPAMPWKQCSGGGSCTTKQGKVVLDANWRWTHTQGGSTNCYTGNAWNASICSSNEACASKCVVDGADYGGTYGVRAQSGSLSLKFITKHQYGTSIGSRMYLMENDNKYQMFQLLNKEFTFDVDMATVGCGLNAALYFVSMDADGGASKYKGNKAGAKYGTGYCDAQCPRDIKFINGQANAMGWNPSKNDPNAGVGAKGSCCAEMDVWEANSISAALTPHSCKDGGAQTICNGDDCGGTYSSQRYAGACDADGCDFNSYRMGDPNFYGKGKTVDTSKKFTVVTQFIGSPLREIKRFYVQNGKVIPNSMSKIPGIEGNSITPEYCDAQNKVFGGEYGFKDKGGFQSLSQSMSKGMVLVMSLWDDHYADMAWLDSTWPRENPEALGRKRGECVEGDGVPSKVESVQANAQVTFSNIKFGEINSTFSSGGR